MTDSSQVTELSDAAERARRQALLTAPHMAPLAQWARGLERERAGTIVPMPDPLDGGVRARVLFLLEKPGPKTEATGFISRDNPDPTARAVRRFSAEAGIPREAALLWNAIPWWNGTTKIASDEIAAGRDAATALLGLLPDLRAVVTVGKKAEAAWEEIGTADVPHWSSAHPSGQVRARWPERWNAIPGVWAEAWAAVEG